MTPYHLAALAHPFTEPGQFLPDPAHPEKPHGLNALDESGVPLAKILSHWEHDLRHDGVWRVLLFVDATGTGGERWPCWHCIVTYGEQNLVRKGIAGSALPLEKWRGAQRREAVRLLTKYLTGVGDERMPLRLGNIVDALTHWRQYGGQPPAGLSGRRGLSGAEVARLCAGRPELRATIEAELSAAEQAPLTPVWPGRKETGLK